MAYSTVVGEDAQPNFEDISVVAAANADVFSNDQKKRTDYQCSICYEFFANNGCLKAHQQTHLRVRESHICSICGSHLLSVTTLRLHHQNVHGKKTIKCDFCDKKFSCQRYLKVHMLRHNNEPMKCDRCGKTLKNLPCLYKHMQKHNRKLTCNYVCGCGKAFMRQYYYDTHQKSCDGEVNPAEFWAKARDRRSFSNEREQISDERGDSARQSDEAKEPSTPTSEEKAHILGNEKRMVMCEFCLEERPEDEIEYHQTRMHVQWKTLF